MLVFDAVQRANHLRTETNIDTAHFRVMENMAFRAKSTSNSAGIESIPHDKESGKRHSRPLLSKMVDVATNITDTLPISPTTDGRHCLLATQKP